MNYSSLSKIMAKEDLGGLLCLQQLENIDLLQNTYNGYLLSSWEKTIENCNKVELGSTVIPLSHSEEIKNQVLSRLASSGQQTNPDVPLAPVFRIVDIERNAFAIVINEGFLDSLQNDQGKLTLIEELLKLFYVYCKFEDVAKTSLFSTYVNLLSYENPKATAIA